MILRIEERQNNSNNKIENSSPGIIRTIYQLGQANCNILKWQ